MIKKSQRKLAFFILLHMAFYAGFLTATGLARLVKPKQ